MYQGGHDDVGITEADGSVSVKTSARGNSPLYASVSSRPLWLVSHDQLVIKESIGKGPVGDFSKALLDGKEVPTLLYSSPRHPYLIDFRL